MEIIENAVYKANNLISFRGQLTQGEIQDKLEKLHAYIEYSGAIKAGAMIVSTYSVDITSKTSDTEVFVPINRVIPATGGFVFVPELIIAGRLMSKHKGNPALLPETYAVLTEKAKEMGCVVASPLYNVYVCELSGPENVDSFEVDIYVSVGSM